MTRLSSLLRPRAEKSVKRSRDTNALSVRALDRWQPQMRAVQASADDTVIDIYDVIGADFWTGGGITSQWIAEQIRGRGDLTININSPGGDFFEGLAIYQLLKSHKGKKTVNIVGLAASAASLISAAGDDVLIGAAAYVMIHNVWGLVVGDKNDMASAAATFEKFDAGARVIYAEQSDKTDSEITELMNDETWFWGQEAIDEGFATGLLPSNAVIADGATPPDIEQTMSLRKAEASLCQVMPRRDARKMLNQIRTGKQDAAGDSGKQDAAAINAARDGLRSILSTLKL